MSMICPDARWVAAALPARAESAHKGSFGTLGVLAGCRQYRGAALLCAMGAARAGAGVVRLASIEAVCAAAAVRLPGCVLLPLCENAQGGIAPGGGAALAKTRPAAIAAGCGLGNTPDAAALVRELLAAALPLVLDADALNAMAGRLSDFLPAKAPVILTPHPGELARLSGMNFAGLPPEEALREQARAARSLAARYGCVVVAKSHKTAVAAPGGGVYQSAAPGNAGLAKAGSGDVLAGNIGGLLAQGMAPGQAAAAGVWLHAEAGAAVARRLGKAAMLAEDLPAQLARVLKRLEAPG